MAAEQVSAWEKEARRLSPTSLAESAVDWSRPPDLAQRWIPDKLLPLHGSAAFANLSAPQQLTYNQAYARQLLEEFIWIESRLIIAPLRRIGRSHGLGPDAQTVIDSFLEDERNHIACFTRLHDAASRAAGTTAQETFFHPPLGVRAIAAAAGHLPRTATFWPDAVATFEDYALSIGKHYNEDPALDGMFRAVFVAHARDEARHCRFDHLLRAWLMPEERVVRNKINLRVGGIFRAAYYATGWGLSGPIQALVDAFPELAAQKSNLLAAARAARTDTTRQ